MGVLNRLPPMDPTIEVREPKCKHESAYNPTKTKYSLYDSVYGTANIWVIVELEE